MMTRVSVFGTFHVDRPGKVETELTDFSRDTDVYFVESPKNEPDRDDKRKLLLRNPIILVTGLILNFFWGLLGYMITRNWMPVDAYVTDTVSQDLDIEIERVDMNLTRRASDVSIWIILISWFIFLFSIALFVTGLLIFNLTLILLAVVVGFAPLAPFAYWTLSERDEVMAENILEFVESHDEIDDVCLVVGGKHMKGVVDQLAERGIEVERVHKSKFLRHNS